MGSVIDFDASLEIGHEQIDKRRREFVGIVNQLNSAVECVLRPEKLMSIFIELYKYCDCHCKEEEELMSKINYPHLNEHKAEHEDFSNTLDEFSLIFCSGDVSIGKKMLDWLSMWFAIHISVVDMRLVEYLK